MRLLRKLRKQEPEGAECGQVDRQPLRDAPPLSSFSSKHVAHKIADVQFARTLVSREHFFADVLTPRCTVNKVKPRTSHLPTLSSAQNTLTASRPLLWTIGATGPRSGPTLEEMERTREICVIVFDQRPSNYHISQGRPYATDHHPLSKNYLSTASY